MFRALYKASVLLVLISFSAFGQTEGTKTDSITGRVVNESGQPLPNARVSVVPVGGGRPSSVTSTDSAGTFKVTGLEPVAYRIYVEMPGYLSTSDEPEGGPSAKQYKAGDSPRFVFTKGGVITGTVTTANGEPVIGIGVRAYMIRNQKDQRTNPNAMVRENSTDDRGVYRIYGLPTGTYKIAAGGPNVFFQGPLGAFDSFIPTYAPSSSTRDGAVEISVRVGDETNDVDINFRREMGRTISGTVSGAANEVSITVNLTTVAPAGSQSNVSRSNQPGITQFAFQGIADGDYYLTAQSQSQTGETALSEPQLIRVRGADVEDVDLTFKALGSVSGRVLLEETKAAECQGKQSPPFKEMFVSAWHRDSETARNQPQFIWSTGAPVSPDAQGNFTIRSLVSSQYYFAARFPARSWYLKSIAMSPAAATPKPRDVTHAWTNVKQGDRLSGLIVTLAQGGASLQGQVTAGEGETVPEKLFVYLVPVEREAADDLLRFYGTTVSEEGKIGLFNLAPGRYWILAQPASDIAQAPIAKMRLPDETETRARLRRDAEAAKTEIEFKPCQSVVDFRLPLKAPSM
jgi:hypothetical protein